MWSQAHSYSQIIVVGLVFSYSTHSSWPLPCGTDFFLFLLLAPRNTSFHLISSRTKLLYQDNHKSAASFLESHHIIPVPNQGF